MTINDVVQYQFKKEIVEKQGNAQPYEAVLEEQSRPLPVVRHRCKVCRDQEKEAHEERLVDRHEDCQDYPADAVLRRRRHIVPIAHRTVDIGGMMSYDQRCKKCAQVVQVEKALIFGLPG